MRFITKGGVAGAVLALAAVATLPIVGVASGTPATGSAVTTALNRATIEDAVIVNTDAVQLHVHTPADVAQTNTVAQAGWSSGWHSHTGPVLVSVKTGALRITNGECLAASVAAGQVFVERPGVRYQAQNLGPGTTEWFTTQLIPQGASTRIDEPAACGI
jgi:quercetin dioxygenase-like cupin family protein